MNEHKRVLLKLSGEQFAGKKEFGLDPDMISWVADEIVKAQQNGVQLAIVAGGGNIVRGAELAGNGIDRATADYMGMVSGVINGQALMDVLLSKGIKAHCMSSIKMDQVTEPFVRRKAMHHLQNHEVVIITGGIGKPFYTHDMAGVTLALELGCDIFLKSTKVDGVFDKDPQKHADAVKLDHVTYANALENPDIYVMDKAALGLAMEQKMPVRIFKLEEDSINRAAHGEELGTLISE